MPKNQYMSGVLNALNSLGIQPQNRNGNGFQTIPAAAVVVKTAAPTVELAADVSPTANWSDIESVELVELYETLVDPQMQPIPGALLGAYVNLYGHLPGKVPTNLRLGNDREARMSLNSAEAVVDKVLAGNPKLKIWEKTKPMPGASGDMNVVTKYRPGLAR